MWRGRSLRVRSLAAVLVLAAALVTVLVTVLVVRGGSADEPRTLTNGCTYDARGIPSCGAYVGGAYGSNSDVATWEDSAGGHLGVHRVFYGPGEVGTAVRTATSDAAQKRITWMSFKAPHSWAEMADGMGDDWAKDLATRLADVDGPVWLAVHHEPENETGVDIADWTAMQERLAPIVRAAAPNVAYTVILMGYPELYGDGSFALEKIWPDTTVDVAGFDVYERYGVVEDGVLDTKWTDFEVDYFAKLQAWAAEVGTQWGLAETGYSDPAAAENDRWLTETYDALVAADGIAFSYFNTNLNSKAHWALDTAGELAGFAAVNRDAPRMR